jgi:hypothetical protein
VFLSTDPSLDLGDRYLGQFAVNVGPGGLAVGASYDASLDVTLPESIGGTFYVLVFTDANVTALHPSQSVLDTSGLKFEPLPMGRVPEFLDEGNNITGTPLQVLPTPIPDLQVSTVTIPQKAVAGQSFELKYTVTNAGAGDTPPSQGKWDDQVYLSVDPLLDLTADRYVGDVGHTGGLAAGQSYSIDQSFRLPRDLVGAFYVFVITDPPTGGRPRGAVFEGSNEGNNATPSPQPLLIEEPPPSDLQVGTITVPPPGQAGYSVKLRWTVFNRGDNPAQGSWTDAAYLSPDPIWHVGDPLPGHVPISPDGGALAPGDFYTATLQATLPAVKPGTYYVIVRTDIFNEVYEGPTGNPGEQNNTTASADTVRVSAQELQLGPAGDQIVTSGDLVGFFAKVRQWYGDDPKKINTEGTYFPRIVPPPDLSRYDLNLSHPTHSEAFNIYVPYGDLRLDLRDVQAAPPANFAAFLGATAGPSRRRWSARSAPARRASSPPASRCRTPSSSPTPPAPRPRSARCASSSSSTPTSTRAPSARATCSWATCKSTSPASVPPSRATSTSRAPGASSSASPPAST